VAPVRGELEPLALHRPVGGMGDCAGY